MSRQEMLARRKQQDAQAIASKFNAGTRGGYSAPQRKEGCVKLMHHSTPCRAVSFLIAHDNLPIDEQVCDLMKGEHMAPENLQENPKHSIPWYVESGFALNGSEAIMRYLAQKYDSKLYPKDIKKQAYVDEMMNWAQNVVYKVTAYVHIYPHMGWGLDTYNKYEAGKTADVMNMVEAFLSKSKFICGDTMTLADLQLYAVLSQNEWVTAPKWDSIITWKFFEEVQQYPSIGNWYNYMKELDCVKQVNAKGFDGFCQYMSMDAIDGSKSTVSLEDGVVTLAPYFKLNDIAEFKRIWREDFRNFQHKDDCVHYSFGFTDDGRAHCREAYKNAEGVLQHLADVKQPFGAVLAGPAELERLEIHGPAAEIEKLRDTFTPLGAKFFVSEWGFRPSKPAQPNFDSVCHLYPYFTLKDSAEFKKIWSDAYPATKAAAAEEKSHQYSFSFEEDSVASCRESYADAEGILTHLKNVDTPLKAVLSGPADLLRLEVHGPKEENDKLKDALGPLGCVFYNTEWGFRAAV